MSLEITYEHPDFPKGHPFSVYPLGTLLNGEPTLITEEQEAEFAVHRGQSVKDYFAGNKQFKVSGTAGVKGEELTNLVNQAPPKNEEVVENNEGGDS